MIDKGVGMQLHACWDCGFESRREYECLLWLLFAVRYRSLRRADHSSREVQMSVVSLSATVTLRKLGRRGPMGHLAPWKKKKIYIYIYDLNLYAPCILYIGQTYRYSPEYSFYIFSQQMYLIIIIIFFRISLTFFVYSSTKCLLFPNVILLGS